MKILNLLKFEEKENPRESLGYTRPQPPDAEVVMDRIRKERYKQAPPSPLLAEYLENERKRLDELNGKK